MDKTVQIFMFFDKIELDIGIFSIFVHNSLINLHFPQCKRQDPIKLSPLKILLGFQSAVVLNYFMNKKYFQPICSLFV